MGGLEEGDRVEARRAFGAVVRILRAHLHFDLVAVVAAMESAVGADGEQRY